MKSTTRAAPVITALSIAACAAPNGDQAETASGVLVTSSDGHALYVASADDDLVARVRPESTSVSALALPGEPTRITRIGDRLLVTLRARRGLAELHDDAGGLALVRIVDVGAEPFGVVASPDGTRIYLSESLEGRVRELDAYTFETLREWTFEGQPRGLAVHPSGETLFVAAAGPSALFYIDLSSGGVSALAAPEAQAGTRGTTPRLTGDPTVSSDGRFLGVPTLHVQHDKPVPRNPPQGLPGYGGATPHQPIERFQAGVALYPLEHTGRPVGTSELVRLRLPERGGYAASVRFTPDGEGLLAAIEGGDVVVATRLEARAVLGVQDGFVTRSLSVVAAPEGTRGLAFDATGTPYAFGFLDRSVAPLSLDLLFDDRARRTGLERPGAREVPGAISITAHRRAEDWEEGRRLFYSTYDRRVSGPEVNVSCATCHFEGRDDGLTWVFDDGHRQTPSLAGGASAREPVTWTGAVATVAADAMATGSNLMGAPEMNMGYATTIATYIDTIRAVDPPADLDAPDVARGRALFERADVGCAGCHSGPQLTDNQVHLIASDIPFKTPSLRGVVATPPYLHDGIARDLREVIDFGSAQSHGRTSHLLASERADLEAYLRAL